MEAGWAKRLAAVAVVTLVVAALVHTSADFDSCLWNGTAHRGANHSNHACQICSLGSWAEGPSLPRVGPAGSAIPLDLPASLLCCAVNGVEVSGPRAPPAFPV